LPLGGGDLEPYKLIAADAAKKWSSALPNLDGVKKRLWKKQARGASTTGVTVKEAASKLAARSIVALYSNDRTAKKISVQVPDQRCKFIAAQQSPGLTPAASSARNSRNLVNVASAAVERMQS